METFGNTIRLNGLYISKVDTIAGDDTILVVTPDNPMAEAVQEKLLHLLEEN